MRQSLNIDAGVEPFDRDLHDTCAAHTECALLVFPQFEE